VDLSFTMSGGSSTSTICYDFPNILANGDGTVVIAANEGPVATQLTLDTNASDCSAVLPGAGGSHQMHSMHRSSTAGNNRVSSNKTDRTIPVPAGIAFAGLLLVGFLGRYSRKFRAMAGLVALLAVGLAVSACGGGGSAIVTTPSDSYTVTVTGTDSATSTITSTTTFTLTVNQ
jgi:hypothetical protein